MPADSKKYIEYGVVSLLLLRIDVKRTLFVTMIFLMIRPVLYINAAAAPSDIRVSIPGAIFFTPITPFLKNVRLMIRIPPASTN